MIYRITNLILLCAGLVVCSAQTISAQGLMPSGDNTIPFNTSGNATRPTTPTDLKNIIGTGYIDPAVTTPQTMTGPLSVPILNSVPSVDGFAVYGTSAQTGWSGSMTYTNCQAVNRGGNNYLAVAGSQNVTPEDHPLVWYQVANANTPTSLDCAFYTAASLVNGNNGQAITLGNGVYQTCIGLVEPTPVGGSGRVSLLGASHGGSVIQPKPGCTLTNNSQWYFPNAVATAGSKGLGIFTLENITFDSLGTPNSCMDINGTFRSIASNWECRGVVGADAAVKLGGVSHDPTDQSWNAEDKFEHGRIYSKEYGSTNIATVTYTLTDGIIGAPNVMNGGDGYTTGAKTVHVLSSGDGWLPCTTPPEFTIAFAQEGSIPTGTSTITTVSGGTGCDTNKGPIYLQIQDTGSTNRGLYASNITNSQFYDIVVSGEFASYQVDCMGCGENVWTALHPNHGWNLVHAGKGHDTFIATDIDSPGSYGFYNDVAASTFVGTNYESGGLTSPGASIFFLKSSGNQVVSVACTANQNAGGFSMAVQEGGPIPSLAGYHSVTTVTSADWCSTARPIKNWNISPFGQTYTSALTIGAIQGTGSPAVNFSSGTGTIGTGSTHVAGTINISGVSTGGSIAFQMTWASSFAYAHRAVCTFTDETMPGYRNATGTTQSTPPTTTTLNATGTVAVGDVLSYVCAGY